MRRSTVARRYLPLALVVAVQALIIAVVPSTGPGSASLTSSGGPASGYSTGGAGASSAGGSAASTAAGASGSSLPGGVAGASAGAAVGGSGSTASAAGNAAGSTASGSGASPTAHCVAGREFSPAVDFYAPPCTPGTPGAARSNPGATYPGVTGTRITVVDYVTDYGTETNTVLQAQGKYESLADAQLLDAAFQNFINQNYVLWGRKLQIVTYAGKCASSPPNYSCLLAEMDSIVTQYKPFAVFWETTLCSACFARLAQDHTVAIGGVGFSDAFSNANGPFYYGAGESASRMESDFASFWCHQLTSVGSSRRTSLAENNNPAQDFNGKPRVLGVISSNDPDNENTVTNVLEPALQKDCGDKVYHTYFYSQDINTAAQQTEAGMSAMDTPTNPATDVLCLCGPVAAAFIYEGESSNNYWPENLLADVQGLSSDATSQSYMSGLACPQKNKCAYDDAFGLSDLYPEPAEDQLAGYKVFRAGGGSTLPLSADFATTVWENYNMLASLIENAGPDLSPARMQGAAPSLGVRGGGASGLPEFGFAPGDYNWTQDVEVAYWDKTRTSAYDGGAGTMVPIEGTRFTSDFPTLQDPPVPTNRP
ncbi:MAG TPA: hypothetical protein VMU63_06935 [Acidimicrobiales bacterium]|nr:hypothetical protein [Acidimicrobiales bacterium]